MSETATEVVAIVKRYVGELEQNNFHIKSAVVFGSYAHQRETAYSDIDVALVSDDFEGNRFMDKEKIRKITLRVDYRLSPLPYRSEQFNRDDLLVREILRTGLTVV